MCLHPIPDPTPRPPPTPVPCPAKTLTPSQRQHLALHALAGTQPIAHLAHDHDVSRKFVYQQADRAQQALEEAFDPTAPDDEVLFYLPVTKAWLRQLVLALVLICHSPLRGVVELLADLFDYDLSLGTVFNIVHRVIPRARDLNQRQSLSPVRIGAHDEIFQADTPVLVGVDVRSTYCYLLSPEEHRDAETWGVRLLELVDRGFAPDATIADGGTGLRAGQKLALPGVPCRGDVFHPLYELGKVLRTLETRAEAAITARGKLESKQADFVWRHGRQSPEVGAQLRRARASEERALALYEDVATLARWLRQDVLAVAGPDLATRQALYDFIVAELRARQDGAPPALAKVATTLAHGREEFLAFAAQLDHDLQALSEEWQVSVALLREVLAVQALDEGAPERWEREAALRQGLGGKYYLTATAVAELAAGVVRASSVAENLNSRLRVYFFLRRQVGPDSLALLQFFLNHRRFQRSEQADRVGKSPAELLTGQAHAHWLELMGFRRFKRS